LKSSTHYVLYKKAVKFAIVTVSYNAAATISDTLESVAHQRNVLVDHWVIDGGSTDGSVAVIKRYEGHLGGYVSEPDGGLYDAMNKGVAFARGDVIGFINADDWYASPEALAQVDAAFSAGADLVYGDLVFVTADEPFHVKRVWRDRTHKPLDFFRYGWQPAHPTTFVRRELFESIGGFDTRWRIGADYAFLAKVMQQPNVVIQHLPSTLVNMRLGGASTAGLRAIWRSNMECAKALSEMGRWPWGTIGLKTLRKLPQIVSSRVQGYAPWRPWAEGRD
jgi:glycosyltransferase involved in cell wall biosynthesis